MSDRPLGDVLTLHRDPVALEDDQVYATVGVYSYGRGLFERPLVAGRDTSYSTYYKLNCGQLVYSKLFAWEGALAVVDEHFSGMFVSQEFPTFDIDPKLAAPEYVALLCSWPGTWARVRMGETGMGGRRKRVHPDRLLEVQLPFPSLADQCRIVDLVASADKVIHDACVLASASRQVLSTLQSAWRNSYSGPMRRLGDLADLTSGPSWRAADERPIPQPGYRRVLGITNTPRDAEIDLTDTRYVSGLPARTRLLARGSLLMIRTNGNRTRIGNVYRVPSEAHELAYSAFQIGIHLRDAPDADFAYWMLRDPALQQTISENASGTTGLGNIAVNWLKELKVPWPGTDERRAAVELFDAIDSTTRAAVAKEKASLFLRSALLSDLLCGIHNIPHTYDALLESA
jgi:type I restriction enzyme, S subunit